MKIRKCDVLKGFSVIIAIGGATMIAVAVAADRLGTDGDGGLGDKHTLLSSAGFVVLVAGLLFRSSAGQAWSMALRRYFSVALTWLILSIAVVSPVELCARYLRGYHIWSFELIRSNYFEIDRMKVWNRKFYEEHRSSFVHWPIPLEFFDAKTSRPRYLFKPNLRMAYHQGKLVSTQLGGEAVRSTNAWGFRGPEFSIKKPPSLIRIVCLGASTTEGSQGDQETYPFFLHQELVEMFPEEEIEVINAGHHGQGIADLLEILRQRVLPLQPDIVIYYQAANDIDVYDFLSNIHCKVGWPQGDCWLYAYPGWYRWLYKHSAIFVLLSDRLGWNKSQPPFMNHEFDDVAPKNSAIRYKAMLSQIVRETLDYGSIIVLSSFIPLAHEGLEVSYEQNPLLFDNLYKKWYPLTPRELERIYQYFNRQSAQVAREFGVPYADVAAQFPRDIRYFPFDIIHLSPDGNWLLAAAFADYLSEKVLPHFLSPTGVGQR